MKNTNTAETNVQFHRDVKVGKNLVQSDWALVLSTGGLIDPPEFNILLKAKTYI